jgi:hypothetical protein
MIDTPTPGSTSSPDSAPGRARDIAIAAVLGLAIALSSGLSPGLPPGAKADEAPEGWLPEIPLSSELSGEPVASGTLETAAGETFEPGLPVVLWGWPTNNVLASMADGDTVHLTPLGKALTDENGEFELRIDDPAAAERLADDDGTITLEVQGWSDDSLASYSFSTEVDGTGGSVEIASTDVIDVVAQELDATAEVPAEIGSVFDKTDVCGATKLASYVDVDTIVGRMYATTGGIASYFSLRAGVDTTLGIGVSVSGKYGSYKQSGTSKVDVGDTFTWGKKALSGGRQFKTDFTYAKYSHWCYPISGGSSQKTYYSYSVRPIKWEGGGFYGTEAAPAVGSGNCRPFAPNSMQQRTTSTATTTSRGVQLTKFVGLDLSSQVGYSTGAVARIYNTTAVQKSICGTNGVPTSPGRYLARG